MGTWAGIKVAHKSVTLLENLKIKLCSVFYFRLPAAGIPLDEGRNVLVGLLLGALLQDPGGLEVRRRQLPVLRQEQRRHHHLRVDPAHRRL